MTVLLYFFILLMPLLDGRKVSSELLDAVAKRVLDLKQGHNVQPKLVIILVGGNPASLVYVKHKKKACERVGILFEQINYTTSVTTEELIKKIHDLNSDQSVHGIIVQLPLPEQVYMPEVIKALDPKKDVDGFQAYNLGKMLLSSEFERLVPCTPMGVIKLLEHYKIPFEGQDVTVVGRSNLVGKPMAIMCLNRGATVNICHAHTKDLASYTSKADIVVVAVGKPNLIRADMVKTGAVIVDVGINKVGDQIVGDVDFEPVAAKAAFITPVPGGVGPMTVACLMENVVRACEDLSVKVS